MLRTILIPVYNEAAILPSSLQRLSAFAHAHFGQEYELLFVDDGSTDASAALIRAHDDPATRLLSYPQNRGKGYAVRTGMLAARGARILFTDCDLAYGTDALLALDRMMEESGADLVVGSRTLHADGYAGYTWLRRLLSHLYFRLLRLCFGLRLSDSQSGLKGFTAAAAAAIFPHCQVDRFAFDFEAILIAEACGLKLAEMPARVVYNSRESKVRPVRDGLRMLRDLFAIHRRVRRLKKENIIHIEKENTP